MNDDDFECRPIRPLRPLPFVVILDRCLTMPLRIEEVIFPVSAPIVMAFTDPATCFLVFKKLSDRLLQFLGVSPISGTAQGWHVDTLSPIGLGLSVRSRVKDRPVPKRLAIQQGPKGACIKVF